MATSGKRSTRREVLVLGGLTLGVGALTAAAQAGERKPGQHAHLEAALRELKNARKYLKEAPHDFGGHRAEAVELIDKTILQLEICLKY